MKRKILKEFIKSNGYTVHSPLDGCPGCRRYAAVEFVLSLPGRMALKEQRIRWIVSDEFDG